VDNEGIGIVTNAGKYLVESRGLLDAAGSLTAVEAAHSPNPEIQAFAILSVLLARLTGANDDGWVSDICSALGIPEVRRG
jgi:hypothetical protein